MGCFGCPEVLRSDGCKPARSIKGRFLSLNNLLYLWSQRLSQSVFLLLCSPDTLEAFPRGADNAISEP